MTPLAAALAAIAIASASTPQAPGWEETETQRAARVEAIAEAIADEASSEREAAILMATAIAESGLARDIDEGPCYRGPGARQRCDFGRSACIFQVHVGRKRTPEGWTSEDLFEDRTKCVAAAARVLRWSLSNCPKGSELSAYLSGRCDVEHEESARRMRQANRILVGLREWKRANILSN